MRILRAVTGVLLLLVATPLALAGGGLWLVMGHRGPGGAYTASVERLRTDGYAIVVPDVDAVLRADAPFARGGQTTLSLSARGPGGPLFLGLGPYPEIARYLAGVAQARVTRVRPARGPLPVDVTVVAGRLAPATPPVAQPYWRATSTGLTRDGRVEDALTWVPASARGRHLGFVVMNADGSAGLDVTLAAALAPAWLGPTTAGLLTLGTMLALLALLALFWPLRTGQVGPVPVAEPATCPPVAAEPVPV
jgi:hypothetical protein